jgi:hypothetical protein
MFCTKWLLACHSRIVYERLPDNQVFYVFPVESILGKLPVVPVGDTGTIPYCMLQHADDFVSAAFASAAARMISPALRLPREGVGDGRRWWYINTRALSWSYERGEK